jgi:hypothetical protein
MFLPDFVQPVLRNGQLLLQPAHFGLLLGELVQFLNAFQQSLFMVLDKSLRAALEFLGGLCPVLSILQRGFKHYFRAKVAVLFVRMVERPPGGHYDFGYFHLVLAFFSNSSAILKQRSVAIFDASSL